MVWHGWGYPRRSYIVSPVAPLVLPLGTPPVMSLVMPLGTFLVAPWEQAGTQPLCLLNS